MTDTPLHEAKNADAVRSASSLYGASKHAVQAMAESYRDELSQRGIQSQLIEALGMSGLNTLRAGPAQQLPAAAGQVRGA